jgi:phytoene desaturase
MRIVIVGAGLGGLAAGLRLQGAGHDVVVLEQRATPGGRAGRLRDGGFTWDTGPSLITMPWVLEEAFAAGGLDLRAEVALRPLDPFYRIRWANDERAFDFTGEAERMRAEIAQFSARDAARYDDFVAALRPVYEEGILGAGRRAFGSPLELARLLPRLVTLRAAGPLWRFVASYFEHPRIRETFSFHSLFIGGDPFRVPAIYAALVYLQLLDGVWYADGGLYSVVEAMARALDLRCGDGVERVETRSGRVTGVVTRGGERHGADAVVLNTDVGRTHELLGRRPPVRRLRSSMSCFLLYLGTDRTFDRLLHHTLLVGHGYREFIADVTRRRRLPRTFSSYVHAPARTEPAMAAAGGDSLAVLLPVPNLAGRVDWAREGDGLGDALVADLEATFGLEHLAAAVGVEHRMTPPDFRHELGAELGNAFGPEPTLHQSAWFRQPNRSRLARGLYHVGAGTHPGAGVPGVVLGAEVTAGLLAEDLAARRDRVAV